MIFNAIIKNRDVIIQGYPILVDELPIASQDIAGKIYAVGTTSPQYYICEENEDTYQFVRLFIPDGVIELTNLDEIDVKQYASAQITDVNLIAENIVKDITILGVTGSYEPELENKVETIYVDKETQFPIILTPDEGFDGIEEVSLTIDVADPILEDKEIEIEENGEYGVDLDPAYDGLGNVYIKVNVPIPDGYIKPTGTKTITDLGNYDVKEYENVQVSIPTEEKEFTPTEKIQEYTSTDGFISKVTVNPIPDDYLIPSGNININNTANVDVSAYRTAQVVDENLKSENIANGVSILGIQGTFLARKAEESIRVTPTKEAQVVTPDDENKVFNRVEIDPIPANYIIPEGSKSIKTNGTYNVTEFTEVEVDIDDIPAIVQAKTVTADTSTKIVHPDPGYEGLSSITINPTPTEELVIEENGEFTPSTGKHISKVTVKINTPEGFLKPEGSMLIEENGTYDVTSYASVDVNISPEEPPAPLLQEKEVTQNGDVLPDDGYIGLSKVTVKVPDREIKLESKEVTPSLEEQEVIFDAANFDGLASVKVNPIPEHYISSEDESNIYSGAFDFIKKDE